MALSNRASKPFLNRFVECFKQNKDAFPMHAQSLPEIKLTRDIGRSDHKSFWKEGYPAVMLTDTANFRNKNYHTNKDTADTLNYNTLTRVASDLCATVEQLALQ